MIEGRDTLESVVVLADESADWKVAGLRQLDRLVLALNEFAGAGRNNEILIFCRPDIPTDKRWLPNDTRTKRVRTTESLSALHPGVRFITTRFVVDRNAIGQFLETTPILQGEAANLDTPDLWRRLFGQFESACRDGSRWQYLSAVTDIRTCERVFLSRSGKPQDGIVSRLINRPLSRPVTRLLLNLPIKPTTWTLSMLAQPLVALVFLLRGDYVGILIGTTFYQLSSMLDGCDGEIARAKYLESKRGAWVDDICDLTGGFLFMIGLGFGLYHSQASVWYAAEGILWTLIMAANELLLRASTVEIEPGADTLTGAAYPRHRQLIEHSGVLFLGERFVGWMIQLSKRDVGIFLYLLLALIGLGEWILHLALVLAAPGLVLTGITRIKTRTDRRRAMTR